MAGVVHFTQLLAYVEEAEHAALLSVGVQPISSKGGFPKVHVDCDYRSPVRFGDSVEISLGIVSISGSSLRWRFEMTSADERKICEGNFVTVFVNRKGDAEDISEETRSSLESLLITE